MKNSYIINCKLTVSENDLKNNVTLFEVLDDGTVIVRLDGYEIKPITNE